MGLLRISKALTRRNPPVEAEGLHYDLPEDEEELEEELDDEDGASFAVGFLEGLDFR